MKSKVKKILSLLFLTLPLISKGAIPAAPSVAACLKVVPLEIEDLDEIFKELERSNLVEICPVNCSTARGCIAYSGCTESDRISINLMKEGSLQCHFPPQVFYRGTTDVTVNMIGGGATFSLPSGSQNLDVYFTSECEVADFYARASQEYGSTGIYKVELTCTEAISKTFQFKMMGGRLVFYTLGPVSFSKVQKLGECP